MSYLLPKTPTGSGPFQYWLEWLKGQVARRRILDSDDIYGSETSHGTFLRLRNRPAAVGSTVGHYRVKSIAPDYLVCRLFGGNIDDTSLDGTGDIYIARDPEFRRTWFDGKTLTFDSDGDAFSATYAYTANSRRTKTIAGIAEEQRIFPYYKLDWTVILAASSKNKSGVTDPDGNDIYLVEKTERAWAKAEV